MKRISLAVLLGLALSTLSVRATTVFFDNFQQFANGTTLTQTNYTPNLGLSAGIDTNDNSGENSTTVIASNLLNSTRAFFALGTMPYLAKYRGEPTTGGLTNQAVTLSFNLRIGALKTLNHFGGFSVSIPTINTSDTNSDNAPIIFINDDGRVATFTNAPSPQTFVGIGSWSNLVATVMTNVVVLDFPGGTFSYSLNGTVLTNMPIPSFYSNIFDLVRLEVNENITNSGVTSLGNVFALDNVLLTSGAASTNRDVRNFIAGGKGQVFEQLSAGAPSQSTTGFAFLSSIRGVESNSVVSASVEVPGGTSQTLLRQTPGDFDLQFAPDFTTKVALDAAFSNGTYTLTFTTTNGDLFTPSLNLPTDNYPSTPQVSNFAAAQTIDSTSDFTLTWTAFSAGTTNDFILVDIADALDADVFATPDFDQTNALNGTATQVVIPGGTLAPGTNYTGRLIFGKRTALDTNTVPGAVGITAYFKQTEFPVTTLAAAGAVCTLAPALATNDVGAIHLVTATLTTNGVAAAGVTVNFDVTSGPNNGTNGLGTTSVSGQATFSYSGGTTGTDTIVAFGTVSSLAFTGTATKVWLLPNVPPVANCTNVTVNAGANCTAIVLASAVDNGSSDSDGIIVSRTLSPSGPYALGPTPVTLTVTDNRGGTNSCSATITVVDTTPPTITCPSTITTNVAFGQTNTVVNFGVTVTDNCSIASTNAAPASGSTFPLGTNAVTWTAVDGSANTNICTFNIIVTAAPPQADLALTAASNVTTASLNNAFGYTLTVTNKGPQNATGAQLANPLSSGVVFSNASSSAGTCTNIGGVVTCSFGTLTNGTIATVTVIVTPTNPAVASVCTTATVTNSLVDPVAGNNSATVCTPVVINNLAVTAFKAPKKVALSAKKTSAVGKFSVTIQNRALHAEEIRNAGMLSNLVTVTLSPISTNSCATPVPQLVVSPKTTFPITLASGKSLKLAYTVNFTCATDPLATKQTVHHDDYRYLVTVQHAALDGLADSRLADDVCPHNALGTDPYNSKIKDKGCGLKVKGAPTGTFTNVVTDIVDTRP